METILKLIYGKTSHNECYSTNTKPIKFNYLSNHIYIYVYGFIKNSKYSFGRFLKMPTHSKIFKIIAR